MVGVYEVDYKRVSYPGTIGKRELEFVSDFRADLGDYYVETEMIAEQIEAYRDNNEEVPEQFAKFLREEIEKRGGSFNFVISF